MPTARPTIFVSQAWLKRSALIWSCNSAGELKQLKPPCASGVSDTNGRSSQCEEGGRDKPQVVPFLGRSETSSPTGVPSPSHQLVIVLAVPHRIVLLNQSWRLEVCRSMCSLGLFPTRRQAEPVFSDSHNGSGIRDPRPMQSTLSTP